MSTIKYSPVSYRQAFHDRLVSQEASGEWRAWCPRCEDPDASSTPSASFNFEKGVFHCMSCNWGGKLSDLKSDLKNTKGFDFRAARMKGARAQDPKFNSKKYEGARPLPSDAALAAWHRRLLNNDAKLRIIRDGRGLTEQTLEDWNIGWDGDRYTIPVLDVNADLVNVRRYDPKATSNNKMLNIPGHGDASLFGAYIIDKEETIVLTEGEMDCIVLNQAGIPAATHTSGARSFQPQWGSAFEGKTVYICYDMDEVGKKGAAKTAAIVRKYAAAVYIIELPVDNPGYDISDYLVREGNTAENFRALMAEAVTAVANRPTVEQRPAPPGDGSKLSLEESMSEAFQSDVIDLTVTVAGKQNPPYKVPGTVHVTCDMSAGNACLVCPIATANGELDYVLQPDDERLFLFLRQPPDKWDHIINKQTGANCTKHVTNDVTETYNMEHLIVGNAMDDRDPGVDQAPLTREIYSVSTHATPVNTTARMVGRNVLDPRDARLSFMAWSNEGVHTSLDKFTLTEEMRDEMAEVFHNHAEGQTPLQKCQAIAENLSEHVTRIVGRPNLHIGYDLVWHSPLAFRIGENMLDKGWLEMMVVGDTRTGKSETAIRLAQHYGAGVVKSCEGATFAGLVGGAQQMSKSGPWTVTWGLIPLNDRRLVVLDEVSGLKDKDVIEQMSSIRSSGRAEMTKIVAEQTSARTRLVWITNPGDGSMIADHPDGGMAALRTVVKANEDIARFDFVMAATANEVDSSAINSVPTRRRGKLEYPAQACQNLVLWAWSRHPGQINFSASAIRRGLEEANKIGDRYIADPPLLQVENARFKIYRIAAAIAARTFSTITGETIEVYEEHVESAVQFLDQIYEFEGMGYARKSRKRIEAQKAARERRTACLSYLNANPDTVLHTLQSIGGTTFRPRDFEEMGGMTKDASHEVVKKLLGWKMITRYSRGELRMDKTLIVILRELDDREMEDA